MQSVESFNERYASIRVDGKLRSLMLPFWSYGEILNGLELREQWDVPLSLVPFQGDCHQLLCLETTTGGVVLLNDLRETVQRWRDTQSFESSLAAEPAELEERSHLFSAWMGLG
ncbi:hypothetical protein NBRC116584_20830 [Hydrogenophaga sp. 5NK40-0174]